MSGALPSARVAVVLAVVAGAVATTVLGLLTSGVQATVAPDGVPLAVAVPAGAPQPLRQAAERVAGHGGEQVSWRVTTPDEAARLLDDKAVYGVLELTPGPSGPVVTVVVSGAVNPMGTQVAQQVLTGAGQAVTAAAAAGAGSPAAQQPAQPTAQPVTVRTVHQASAAARTVPLAASQLLWLGCMVGSAVLVAVNTRAGRAVGTTARVVTAVAVPVGVVSVFVGLMALWDSGLRIDARLVGFLLLVAFAFAALHGAVLRLLGLAGLAIIAPLFLIAPAVAGQVPELLHPVYRTLLWSWTPLRFSTEGVRSLLLLDGVPPDVRTAVWVFALLAVVGLAVLLWPGRRRAAEAGPTA